MRPWKRIPSTSSARPCSNRPGQSDVGDAKRKKAPQRRSLWGMGFCLSLLVMTESVASGTAGKCNPWRKSMSVHFSAKRNRHQFFGEPACVHPRIRLMLQETVDTFCNCWSDHSYLWIISRPTAIMKVSYATAPCPPGPSAELWRSAVGGAIGGGTRQPGRSAPVPRRH